MTRRSELQHRIAEARARMMNHVANRAFSTRTTGLDGLAKGVLARAAGPVRDDPELKHDDKD